MTAPLARPVFSVIVPTFNRPKAVRRAVGSVLAQSFDDLEVIVVDDGSETDYLADWAQGGDPRIRIEYHPANRGAAAARNSGLARARGKYLAFLDDDDAYQPGFLAATHACLAESGDDVGASWSQSVTVHVSGRSPNDLASITFPTLFESRQALFEAFMSIGTGYGLTLKRACWQAVGDFNPDLATVEDTDMFLRILSAGFVPTVAPGAGITLHNHSGPRLTGEEWNGRNVRECRWLLERHTEMWAAYPSLARQLRLHIRSLLPAKAGETVS